MSPRKFDRFMVDVHIGASRKLRRLSPAERWCHIAGILPVAAQAPIRGRLLVGHDHATADDFAEMAGVTLSVATAAVEKLRSIGIIVPDEEHGCEQVHDFDDWNPPPKEDKKAAERARRYREKLKERHAVTNGTVTVRDGRDVTVRDAVTVTARDRRDVTPGREEKGIERKEEAKASSRRTPLAPTQKSAEVDEVDSSLCRLFAELAKARNAKFKIRSRSRWLTDMRRLRELDENSPEEIERLLRWLFGDTKESRFWARQIQSPGNLRDHFARLWATMLEETERPRLRAVPSSDEFLHRLGA